jgi:hypothetical protein
MAAAGTAIIFGFAKSLIDADELRALPDQTACQIAKYAQGYENRMHDEAGGETGPGWDAADQKINDLVAKGLCLWNL